MDALKEQIQKPLVLGIGAFLVGVLFGWMLLGWVLFPVQYVDGDPSQLRADYQEDYVKAAADSYMVTADPDLARQRLGSLGESADPALEAARASASGDGLFRLQSFEAVASVPAETGGAEPAGEGEEPAAGSGLSRYIIPACGIVLFLGLLAGGALLLRSRVGGLRAKAAPQSPAAAARRISAETPPADYVREETPTGEQPIAQFMTTYMLGDDLYDDSFSVDSPSGDFLGECGMGISETIGVGDPKKVNSFEVWLFDKNDIRTVTRVLMSEHAFQDETLKSRLSAKGEPVLAVPGEVLHMETASLLVTARVVDLAYGSGALPPNSFFDRITIELAAYSKRSPEAEAPSIADT